MKIRRARQQEVVKNLNLGINGILWMERNNLYRAGFQIGKKRTFKASHNFDDCVAWLYDMWKTHREPLGQYIKDLRPELHAYVSKHPRVFNHIL